MPHKNNFFVKKKKNGAYSGTKTQQHAIFRAVFLHQDLVDQGNISDIKNLRFNLKGLKVG